MTTTQQLKFSARRLRVFFERSGISTRQVGKAMGGGTSDLKAINGHANNFRHYLKGDRTPKLATVYKIAEILGCRVVDLCDVEEDGHVV